MAWIIFPEKKHRGQHHFQNPRLIGWTTLFCPREMGAAICDGCAEHRKCREIVGKKPAHPILTFIYFVVGAHNCTYNWRMKIEFDPDKGAANPLKHEGVTFDEAKVVLLDPYALTKENGNAENGQRFITLGMGAKGRVLIVYLDATRRDGASNFGLESQSIPKETL